MEHLRHDATADKLLPTAQRYLDLQQDLCQTVPSGVLRESRICQFDGGALVIAVPSAAVASRLRQILPGVRDGLENRGWKIISIQLRVQPPKLAEGPLPRVARSLRGLPGSAILHWQNLARTVSPSPLRDAIRALILRHRAGSDADDGSEDV